MRVYKNILYTLLKKTKNKTILAIYFCVAILFVFFACGIISSLLLEPASISSIATEVIRINHNTSNTSESFKGYDIYYKLYRDSDTSKITSDRNYITDSTRVPSLNILTSRNYAPIVIGVYDSSNQFENLNQAPNIKPNLDNLAESYFVYIDVSSGTANYPPIRNSNDPSSQTVADSLFSQGGDEYHVLLINNNDNSVKIIRRNTVPPKGFFSNRNSGTAYSSQDSDIKKMIGSNITLTETEPFKIVFAVIPYGIDFSLAQQSYGSIVMSQQMTIEHSRTP